MKYKFFHIPAGDFHSAEAELNTFCSQHRIVSVEKQFVANGDNSCWSLCLEWVDHEGPLPKASIPRSKVDYKEVLNKEDFTLFAELRQLRKEVAEREGVPPYVVFTNEQLADIVRLRVSTKAALLKLKGVGKGRVDKYGGLFLARMEEQDMGLGQDEKDTD